MPKAKKNKFGKILKNHFLLTIAIIVFYISLGCISGWDLLAGDIKNKKQVAGSTVSALMRIIGPPVTPVLSGSSLCSVENEPYILLNWNVDPDADEYDLYRNKELLMTGITDNFWSDPNVSRNKRYTYYLVARGPEGIAVSEELAVTTIKCVAVANPKVWVEKINDKVVDNSGKKPEINLGRPVFIGQTNIVKAKVKLKVVGREKNFYATTQANDNGYWHWVSPNFFDLGEYNLEMGALDIEDEELFARNSLIFLATKKKIDETDDSGDKIEEVKLGEEITASKVQEAVISSKKDKSEDSEEVFQSGVRIQSIKEERPFDFELNFSQDLKDIFIKGVTFFGEIFRGEDLQISILFSEATDCNSETRLNYRVISEKREILFEQEEQVEIGPNFKIDRRIELPYSWQTGEYKLQVNVSTEDVAVSNEDYFILRDRPLVQVGPSYLTYEDVVGKLSWVIIACLTFLFIFIFLTIWEHHLTRRAIMRVTEKILRKKGFVG